ncbi:BlaI/MecI/CopY family transcriptional regulator [Dasania sp. GY-MA-18]|uniref:BlaI/MecI/CopY family transcriptional regulator n=1 Tax=Dasania phycosphaerae TaxID=2950436 RepID=A0A9J6RHT3_9GAMM|nr:MULTISPECIES: BlaI/MecI/CopY family transcriptional regulator [Dasania]MCR8921339.1 BlaI/MecI/CopY family transcriptional regulator [Dasania sp. GY-MA-18]MCZ0863767.1 BlaI/MecI/CopY family transcriptional regulator [Dasania phycosphaerae]MCZ0867495.1 BlaI/MecI/CopY family transcriptional regulator [Dasania phycosphaerae]
MNKDKDLSRRERQIMDILYEKEHCSAHEVRDNMPDAPSYSTVRALLAKLLEKDQIDHRQEGAKYIYFPKQKLGSARQSALQRLVKIFFGGSTAKAANALLGLNAKGLNKDELDELSKIIEQAREKQS